MTEATPWSAYPNQGSVTSAPLRPLTPGHIDHLVTLRKQQHPSKLGRRVVELVKMVPQPEGGMLFWPTARSNISEFQITVNASGMDRGVNVIDTPELVRVAEQVAGPQEAMAQGAVVRWLGRASGLDRDIATTLEQLVARCSATSEGSEGVFLENDSIGIPLPDDASAEELILDVFQTSKLRKRMTLAGYRATGIADEDYLILFESVSNSIKKAVLTTPDPLATWGAVRPEARELSSITQGLGNTHKLASALFGYNGHPFTSMRGILLQIATIIKSYQQLQ